MQYFKRGTCLKALFASKKRGGGGGTSIPPSTATQILDLTDGGGFWGDKGVKRKKKTQPYGLERGGGQKTNQQTPKQNRNCVV